MRISALSSLLLVAACATTPGTLRFHNREPQWIVDDRSPTPRVRATPDIRLPYQFRYLFHRPIEFVLAVPEPLRARDVNSLGEVPDSTWFTNRIGVRPLTAAEIRRGPNRDDGPVAPWRIEAVYPSRLNAWIRDARGVVFVIKLDWPEFPELSSAAGVISQRLLWAVGYNVPEESVVYFDEHDLSLADDAKLVVRNDESALELADVQALLAGQPRDRAGRYRALASRLLPGEPVGAFVPEGSRSDDPNDRIDHEHRRDLRGQYVFFSWLAHTDIHPGNRLDMWVENPHQRGTGHVVHYILDFDKALGAFGVGADDPWDGYAYTIDYGFVLGSALSLGLWRRPWERASFPRLRGIGRFEARHYAPHRFRTRSYHTPFLYKDDLDCFWGAKILMQLHHEHIRAAVEVADFSDPRSSEYMFDTLVARQRKIGRHWFSRVNPLDRFEVELRGDRETLCATDLLLHHGLARGKEHEQTRYHARAYDWRGRRLAWRRSPGAGADGRLCLEHLPEVRAHDGYLIVGIRTERGPHLHAPVWVHLARNPATGKLRVIGIDRGR